MRTINLIFGLLFCLCSFGQCEIRNICCGKHKHVMWAFEITNKSSEDYYFWIARKPVSNYSEKSLIHDYFFRRNNTDPATMSFSNVIYDRVFPFEHTYVGFSFLKKIQPGRSFYVIGTRLIVDLNELNNRFVTISAEKLEKYMGRIPDYFIYPLCILYVSYNGLSDWEFHKGLYTVRSLGE